MAETKYEKYLFSGFSELAPGQKTPPGWKGNVIPLYLDDEIMKGSNFYLISWIRPEKFPDRSRPHSSVHAPPHIHKYAELLIHLGTNPDDPLDLGAEVTVVLGKEMELHTFNKSTTVYVPANFLHGWWEVKNVKRPWIFIQINQGPLHSKKNYPQLFPKEIRDKLPQEEDEWW